MRTYILLALGAMMCGMVMAADPQPGKEREMRATGADSKMGRGEMNPALKPLSFMEGRWRVEQQMKASYSDKAGEAHGRFNIHRDLNGNALVGNFEAEKMTGRAEGEADRASNFEGHLVISAAQSKDGRGEQGLTMYWADSEGNVSLSKNVKVEGDRVVSEFDAHQHGDKMVKGRVTFAKSAEDKILFTMDQDAGKGWEKVSTATYSRIERGDRGEKASDVKYDRSSGMKDKASDMQHGTKKEMKREMPSR